MAFRWLCTTHSLLISCIASPPPFRCSERVCVCVQCAAVNYCCTQFFLLPPQVPKFQLQPQRRALYSASGPACAEHQRAQPCIARAYVVTRPGFLVPENHDFPDSVLVQASAKLSSIASAEEVRCTGCRALLKSAKVALLDSRRAHPSNARLRPVEERHRAAQSPPHTDRHLSVSVTGSGPVDSYLGSRNSFPPGRPLVPGSAYPARG